MAKIPLADGAMGLGTYAAVNPRPALPPADQLLHGFFGPDHGARVAAAWRAIGAGTGDLTAASLVAMAQSQMQAATSGMMAALAAVGNPLAGRTIR